MPFDFYTHKPNTATKNFAEDEDTAPVDPPQNPPKFDPTKTQVTTQPLPPTPPNQAPKQL